ncbi:hypothetical protein ACET3Z_002520 [Daucus carota]
MAKNQQSQNSSGEYREIYIATSHSLISSPPAPHQTFTISPTTAHAFRLKAAARQLPSSGEVIPIEIQPRLLPEKRDHLNSSRKKTGELTKASSKIKQDAGSTSVPVQHQEKETMNDKFTQYINRVKYGMLRSLSNVESAEKIDDDNEVCITHNF